MKIIHISWTFRFGGIETMLVNIANEQAAMGNDVHICIVEHNNVEKTLLDSLDKRIQMHYADRRYGVKDIMAILRLNKIINNVNPDTIHLHSSTLYKYIIRKRYKKICNSTLHALCSPCNTGCIKDVPRVFAISKAVAADLWEKKQVKSIVNVNGIHPELITTRKAATQSEQLKIVQVSRLDHLTKGQHILIKAGKELFKKGYKNFSIDFIGDGSSMEYLKQLANECGISDHVHFLGAKSQQYIFDNLCKYDLFVQPSIYEGFGLTVAEAMAAKVSVVVSSGQGPEEIVDNGKYGYVFENGNHIDLAEKIELFLNGSNDKEMTEAAYQRVWNLYNIKVTAQNYVNQYLRR